MVKTQFGVKVKYFRFDNAKKFALANFPTEQGTQHQFSYAERPQQNSTVEKKHQHLLNVTQFLFFNSSF